MKPEETVRKARQIYDAELKERLENEAYGKYVVIDANSGRYIVDEQPEAALHKAKQEIGKGAFYLMRIGYEALAHLNTPMSNDL